MSRIFTKCLRFVCGTFAYQLVPKGFPVQHSSVWQTVAQLLTEVERPVIIDGGAHYGETVEQILRVLPSAVVHAIEPNPEAYRRLRGVAERYESQVTTYQEALSDRVGAVQLNIAQDDETSSLKPVSEAGHKLFGDIMKVADSIEVEVTTIDHWREINSVGAVDLLKLDIQGSELDALRGAQKSLYDGVNAILAEVHFLPAYDGAPPLPEIIAFMTDHGFTLYGLYNIYYEPNGRAVQGDALWVSARFDHSLAHSLGHDHED